MLGQIHYVFEEKPELSTGAKLLLKVSGAFAVIFTSAILSVSNNDTNMGCRDDRIIRSGEQWNGDQWSCVDDLTNKLVIFEHGKRRFAGDDLDLAESAKPDHKITQIIQVQNTSK